ncbi:MAG: spore cortex-lytic protein [Oscillospiraceae bacterium]|nr:spore cortex-lytic protein [Oscillospiraceae bacterium]
MAQSGTLHVRVYASQAEIPVVGAAVIVASRGRDGKYQMISLQETDESGNIKPVRVDAPPAGESTSPEQTKQPFAVVDVWVEHPGYEVMWLEDVQIFAGQQTVQQVELNPLVAGESWTERTDVRPIPPQEL